MKRYIYDTQTGAITQQTATYNPALVISPGPVATPDPRYIVCREVIEPQPAHDPITQRLESTTTVDAEAARVVRGWQVVVRLQGPTPPRWQEFRAALRTIPELQALIRTLAEADPMAHLAVGVGLGQAAQGSIETFTGVWSELLAVGAVPPELAGAVQVLAQSADLPEDFIAALA